MTKDELLEGNIRIVFTSFAECEEIVSELGKYDIGFSGEIGHIKEVEKLGIKRYLQHDGVAYLMSVAGKLCYASIDYKEDSDLGEINFFEFREIMMSKNISSSEFCSCSSPNLTKSYAGEWFDYCKICKKERK